MSFAAPTNLVPNGAQAGDSADNKFMIKAGLAQMLKVSVCVEEDDIE
jgi:hypothetical protein